MSLSISNEVFEKTGHDEIAERTFFLAVGAAVCYGLGLTAWVANYFASINYHPSLSALLILGLALPIIGIIMAAMSHDPIISLIGYHLILVPFGVILSPIVNIYAPNVIAKAFGLTACITGIMTVLAVSHPDWFKNLGAPLFFALSGLIVVRILQIFIPFLAGLTIIDYAAAGIFSLYIGYDMYRATHVPKTFDNAVDIAVSLYLDILNLFLVLLRLYGDSDD